MMSLLPLLSLFTLSLKWVEVQGLDEATGVGAKGEVFGLIYDEKYLPHSAVWKEGRVSKIETYKALYLGADGGPAPTVEAVKGRFVPYAINANGIMAGVYFQEPLSEEGQIRVLPAFWRAGTAYVIEPKRQSWDIPEALRDINSNGIAVGGVSNDKGVCRPYRIDTRTLKRGWLPYSGIGKPSGLEGGSTAREVDDAEVVTGRDGFSEYSCYWHIKSGKFVRSTIKDIARYIPKGIPEGTEEHFMSSCTMFDREIQTISYSRAVALWKCRAYDLQVPLPKKVKRTEGVALSKNGHALVRAQCDGGGEKLYLISLP